MKVKCKRCGRQMIFVDCRCAAKSGKYFYTYGLMCQSYGCDYIRPIYQTRQEAVKHYLEGSAKVETGTAAYR